MNESIQNANSENTAQTENLNDRFSKLAGYGMTESVKSRFTQLTERDPQLVPGRIGRIDGISAYVHANSQDYRATSDFARIAHDDEFEIDPARPTVGDWVLVRPGENLDPDVIELVLPRTSLLVRKRSMRGSEEGTEQQLAANIDTVFVVQSATYFNQGRLEREIALVWGSGSIPVIVLSKIDLIENNQNGEQGSQSEVASIVSQAEAVAPGVEVFAASGITGTGTDLLEKYTTAGKTVVLIGASGVGKSTLVNQLMGEEVMDTGDIRESDTRGRHTTTTRQLLPLVGGGVLIDTPGIRTIGLAAGSEEALTKTFSEIEEFLGMCRFRDCAHEREPGCAITGAIASGKLQASRFESYKRMLRELQHEQTKNDPTQLTDHQRRMKSIAKTVRQRNQLKGKN